MFLAKSGKDEVRMGNGEEVALGLGSFRRALAPDAAGADGDQRLANLIAGALGIVVGVDEAGQAGLLEGLEDLPLVQTPAISTAPQATESATGGC